MQHTFSNFMLECSCWSNVLSENLQNGCCGLQCANCQRTVSPYILLSMLVSTEQRPKGENSRLYNRFNNYTRCPCSVSGAHVCPLQNSLKDCWGQEDSFQWSNAGGDKLPHFLYKNVQKISSNRNECSASDADW